MGRRRPPIDIPREGLDTPEGRLYPPLGQGAQIGVLVFAFAGGPALGWLVALVPGDLSESARTMVQVPFVLTFFVGYSVWGGRLSAIAFDAVGRSLLRVLYVVVVQRRKPASAQEVLPTREKLLQMMVRAQKAGASFAPASWVIGLLFGAIAMLLDSALDPLARFVLVAGSCAGWGHLLARFGRRGWLPFMEEA